ncbi:MAG: hypothetical protein PVH18_12630 [Chloroflexota bacterium]
MQLNRSTTSLKETMRRHRAPLILLLLMLFQWAVLFSPNGPSWDATLYYAYARSVVFDGDLRIDNDLQLSYPTAAPEFAAARMDLEKTETGRVASPFAIGSSLLWLPWLAILRGLTGLGQLAGIVPQPLSGYEWYFTLGLATFSMALGWLAFWLAYRLALQVSDKATAALATLTLLFATPLLYYMYAEPLFAHATSAFITALFISVWWRYFRQPSSQASALAIGALLGLACLVRWQHIAYLLLPLSSIAGWWLSLATAGRREQIKRAAAMTGLVLLGTAAVLTLQLAHWRLLYGQWITIPQGAGFVDWSAPYWRQMLFSTFNGLLPWMPVFFLGLAGLALQLKKQRAFILPLLLVLVLETYVSSSLADWFGGGGYGPRRLTSELAILVIGYAGLLQWLPNRIRLIGGGLLTGLLIIHQWLLLRFSVVSPIGGRVLSMAPTYEWAEDGYGTFLRQVGSNLAEVARRPGQALHWPNSPLGALHDGLLPARQVTALVFTLLAIALAGLIAARLARYREPVSPKTGWLLLAIVGLAILGTDLWLLIWA